MTAPQIHWNVQQRGDPAPHFLAHPALDLNPFILKHMLQSPTSERICVLPGVYGGSAQQNHHNPLMWDAQLARLFHPVWVRRRWRVIAPESFELHDRAPATGTMPLVKEGTETGEKHSPLAA